MIDLRSDTLTVPDEGMREVMARAAVGDDIYGEDPTVNELQDRVAAMFGFEAALFVTSGTMGNQISIAIQTNTADEIIADADAHIIHYENAASAVISRVQVCPVKTNNGMMPLEQIEESIRPSAYYYPRSTIVAVENTHNRHGGTVLDYAYLKTLQTFCDEKGLALHCDAARIWNAIASSGVTAAQYGQLFSTMSVCMSKGAGAPVGSLVLASRQLINEARRWRKLLGGGMRQAGILAAGALYALDNIVPNLKNDHLKAALFADEIMKHESVVLERWRVQSNIVMFSVAGMNPDATNGFIQQCEKRGLRISPIKPGVLRPTFHHQISVDQALEAAQIVVEVLNA